MLTLKDCPFYSIIYLYLTIEVMQNLLCAPLVSLLYFFLFECVIIFIILLLVVYCWCMHPRCWFVSLISSTMECDNSCFPFYIIFYIYMYIYKLDLCLISIFYLKYEIALFLFTNDCAPDGACIYWFISFYTRFAFYLYPEVSSKTGSHFI